MKFLVDENIPISCSLLLTKSAHEVIDIRGTDKEGLSDSDIFQLAQNYKAIFITCDKDFFHTIPFQFKIHHGIIVIALNQSGFHHVFPDLCVFFQRIIQQGIHGKYRQLDAYPMLSRGRIAFIKQGCYTSSAKQGLRAGIINPLMINQWRSVNGIEIKNRTEIIKFWYIFNI